MPRRKRASSKNRKSPSRAAEPKPAPVSAQPQQLPELSHAAQWAQLNCELTEHQQAIAAVRERMQALGRRDPNDPNDTPEKDTYVRFDDLVEGAPITGPAAAARPKLTVWWSQDDMTEWLIVALRIRDHFASEEKRTGQRVAKKNGVPYIMQCEPPPGKEMTPHIAQVLFTICRATLDGKGGRIPGKRNG